MQLVRSRSSVHDSCIVSVDESSEPLVCLKLAKGCSRLFGLRKLVQHQVSY